IVLARLEDAVPAVPQALRKPEELAADVAREVDAHDALVGVAVSRAGAGRADGVALPAARPEQAHAHRADVHADAAEHGLARIVVEHAVGPLEPGAVDGEVGVDAV